MNNNSEKKYPKSLSGKQCIGPCYQAGTWILHPVTLEYYRATDKSFCPTGPYEDKRCPPKNICNIDDCHPVTSDINENEIHVNMVLPTLDFTCEYFLKVYYEIFSFENAINFIITNKKPLFTNLRIMECAWKLYGDSPDIINNQLVEFYIDVVKTYWMKTIFKHIKKYINIKNDKISFVKFMPNDNNKSHHIEKINFYIKNIITKNNMYTFLNKYITTYSSDWNNIISHNENILQYLIEFSIELIKTMIK